MSRSTATIAALRLQPRIRFVLPRETAAEIRVRAKSAGVTREEMIHALIDKALKEERARPD